MGRIPSASAHQKVLDATFSLMAERGVDATSMDAIAEASGVSKATIYKHWTDKDALLLEMMAQVNGLHTRPKFDSGDTRDDIVAVLAYRPSERLEMRERIMPHFLAYSARNPIFGNAWRNMAMEPPRRELTRLIRDGIRKGELSPAIDFNVSLAMLLGPIVYWHIFLNPKKSTGSPRGLAEGIVDAFWRAFGVSPRSSKTERSVRGMRSGLGSA
jgi:AcrR family transcriptional regulator